MGLINKIEDKLGSHKNDTTTTDSKHSNSSGLNSSSDNYNTTTGSHNTGATGHQPGLSSGTGMGSSAGTTGGSSLRHPVQSAENEYGRSNAPGSYPTGSSGTGSHIPGTSNTGGSHVPGSSTAGYGGPGGISSRDHAGVGGYGTETHPSLREQERMGGAGYTGPASHTIGPHNSDTANVLDPRVQPDPRVQHGAHTTSGPHQSDLANRADPRVDSDRSNQHHYGRDAALAGGAGTAAAYGAEHHGHHDHHGSHTSPREPYDPYSSSGQRTAAQRQPEDEYGRTGHHTGGIGSRDREPSDLLPGHQAQNPGAIPTAGGATVGSSGYNSSHPGYDDGKKEAYRQSTMGGGPTTAGPHKNDMMNKLGKRA